MSVSVYPTQYIITPSLVGHLPAPTASTFTFDAKTCNQTERLAPSSQFLSLSSSFSTDSLLLDHLYSKRNDDDPLYVARVSDRDRGTEYIALHRRHGDRNDRLIEAFSSKPCIDLLVVIFGPSLLTSSHRQPSREIPLSMSTP